MTDPVDTCIACSTPLPGLPPYAVATVGPDDYDGITDDGDRICHDCWCSVCRRYHDTADGYDRCGFPDYDPHDPELRCDPDATYAAMTDK